MLEASLGYFINPLVSVLLGVGLLHERLRRVQWLAVALAAAGVVWLTLHAGRPPWVALMLAFSFGFYGLIRKTGRLGALEGLTLETLLLAPLVLPALLWLTLAPGGAMARGDWALNGWLWMSGPMGRSGAVQRRSPVPRIPCGIGCYRLSGNRAPTTKGAAAVALPLDGVPGAWATASQRSRTQHHFGAEAAMSAFLALVALVVFFLALALAGALAAGMAPACDAACAGTATRAKAETNSAVRSLVMMVSRRRSLCEESAVRPQCARQATVSTTARGAFG